MASAETDTSPLPSHCEGSRDPTTKIQIAGTHNADETPGCLAGSKRNNASRSINQRNRAKEGGISSIQLGAARWVSLVMQSYNQKTGCTTASATIAPQISAAHGSSGTCILSPISCTASSPPLS